MGEVNCMSTDKVILEKDQCVRHECKEEGIKVSVCCITYNQEDYIEIAIQSFLSQATSFNYEILIHDDASTDRTAEIIRKYEKEFPEIIRCIYQTENQFSQGNSASINLFNIAKGDYIALCEGDDFWVSSNKLQLQYDFMELNSNFSLCAHSGYNTYENGQIKNHLFRPFNEDRIVSTEEIISKWLFPTASLFYRKCLRNPYEIPFAKGAPCGDYPLAIFLSLKGRVQYFDQPMCIYRNKSKGSLSSYAAKNIEYQINFNSKIIPMLENLDKYTNNNFTTVINLRIYEYKRADIFLKEKNVIKLIKSEYLKGYSKKEVTRRLVISLFPNFYRQLAKTKKYLHRYHDRNNIIYEAMSFEDFCIKVKNG